MTTANDLIESAALKLGAKQTGESLTADESNDALNVLNSMLDYWSINNLLIFQIVQNTYTWTGGQASQTIGVGGNFNGSRPIRIEDGTFFRTSGIDIPVRIVRDRASYDRISSKTSSSTYPSVIYYDESYPLGVLYGYPVPMANIAIHLNEWQPLQSFASLTTDLALPPGYRWLIENNLAVALEPIFSLQAPQSVRLEAARSKDKMMAFNHRPITSSSDAAYVFGRGGKGDIYADQ